MAGKVKLADYAATWITQRPCLRVRTLRPGAPLLLSFHVGDTSRVITQGYGHPMKVHIYRRQPGQVAAWLTDVGFTVEAQMTLSSAESSHGGILFARRQSDSQ
jgi:hypothetical protein